jgi:YHS domain-containing protein
MSLRVHLAVALVLLAGLASACKKKDVVEAEAPTVSSAPAALPDGLTRIEDASLVCMVNNTYMGKPQIPVDVDGKTYFGCCPMCKERLAKEADTRIAIDPVNGAQVDKALAVLVKDADGNVLYFGSEDSLRRYSISPR